MCPCANQPPGSATPTTITSSLHAPAWAHYLHDYPNQIFVQTIINIIDHGANIGYSENHNHSQTCSNLHTPTEHPATITADIASQVSAGHTHGPFNEPPLLYFLSLPQGAITHKHHNKIHHIFHLSWPHGLSINDGIPDSEASTVYDMFRKAINDLIASGAGSLIVKLYLEQAFHQIPVCPEDWHLLGFTWAGKFYYNLVVCFGLCSAPYIFNLFAEALHWIISITSQLIFGTTSMISWESFHLSILMTRFKMPLAWMLALGRQLSLQFQASKIDGPSTLIQYLGILLDSIKWKPISLTQN